MKANRVAVIFLLLLSAAVSQLPAQQSEADRKLLDEIRAGAEQGDGQSQFELGRAFFFGKLGVAKDYVEAVKWCRKAAEQNNAEAKFLLGVCFKNGNGVEKDYT